MDKQISYMALIGMHEMHVTTACVCVYVCVCVCMHARMCVLKFHPRMFTYVYACMHRCMHNSTGTRGSTPQVYKYTYQLYTLRYVCTCTYMYMHARHMHFDEPWYTHTIPV